MLLRFRSDFRPLFWAFVLFPVVPALAYLEPRLLWGVAPAQLYLSYCAGVLTHNQTHSPLFRDQRWNRAYQLWLSLFYGCPTFVWIPTHLENHHRHSNGDGDVTRTTRHARRNTLLAALSYPFQAARWQWPLIRSYAVQARARGGARWARVVAETATVVLGQMSLCGLALTLHGPATGGLVYFLALGLPALLSPSFMMLTNYLQHVDCDSSSPDGHSRNFVNPWFNWLVFDNGYHTVHHDRPGLHWSRLRAAHRARLRGIEPHLNRDSPLSYCWLEYVLRRARSDRGDGNRRKEPQARALEN